MKFSFITHNNIGNHAANFDAAFCNAGSWYSIKFFTAIIAGLNVAAGVPLSGTIQNFVSGTLILLWKPYFDYGRYFNQLKDVLSSSIQHSKTILPSGK